MPCCAWATRSFSPKTKALTKAAVKLKLHSVQSSTSKVRASECHVNLVESCCHALRRASTGYLATFANWLKTLDEHAKSVPQDREVQVALLQNQPHGPGRGSSNPKAQRRRATQNEELTFLYTRHKQTRRLYPFLAMLADHSERCGRLCFPSGCNRPSHPRL